MDKKWEKMKIGLNRIVYRWECFRKSVCHFGFLIRHLLYKIDVMAVVCNYILLYSILWRQCRYSNGANIIRWRPRTKISRNLLGTIMATNKQWIYASKWVHTKTNVCDTIKMYVFLSWNAVFLLWWFRWISLLKLSIFLDITCVHLKWNDKRALLILVHCLFAVHE